VVLLKKILVVDSDEQVASILRLKLRQTGFDVVALGNSAEALDAIPQVKPDLIVSEMILPGQDGIDLVKRLKMNPETAHIPFVFLSSSRDVEKKILALSLGAEAVFAKPLFVEDFAESLKEILGGCESKSVSEEDENTLEGDISDISVLNIISIMLENKSSGEVEFSSSADKNGTIFCDNGSIVRVEVAGSGNSDGMEELYKILSWPDGTFSVNYGEVDVERNICIPQKKIIEKSVTWFKEYSEILKCLPPLDTVVYLDFENFVENLNKLPDDIGFVIKNIGEYGSRISEIIDACDGDRKLTAAYLKQLFEFSVLSIENMLNSCKIEVETPEIVEKNKNIADIGKKDEEKSPVQKPDEHNEPERKKSGVVVKILVFIAILVAIAIFIYWRGLI